ncbi:hypothetical protein I302_105779 [Kwoniella bestiolae CBS 10118]|uniref:Uncharacterized protein n=1 Tax=Kwoniella bestiolae CBS 10118 TaxID=1296100 RepID=A0A1B9G256_9TREE|nr:hypothetical protein I302_04901 [Kwoniella bestiolae CBS 10118]OCF25091.1 hypothetical protein I302_04901 [Kwoniella bestiolae CBS 10118]
MSSASTTSLSPPTSLYPSTTATAPSFASASDIESGPLYFLPCGLPDHNDPRARAIAPGDGGTIGVGDKADYLAFRRLPVGGNAAGSAGTSALSELPPSAYNQGWSTAGTV